MNTDQIQRMVIKISGRGLRPKQSSHDTGLDTGGNYGKSQDLIDEQLIAAYADEISKLVDAGVEVAIAVGGSNILNSQAANQLKLNRTTRDSVGILATAINGFVMASAIEGKLDRSVAIMSGIPLGELAYPFNRREADRILSAEKVLVFACGIGQPLIDSDYSAVQRSVELQADAIVMMKAGTDGVYSADPNKYSNAVKIDKISYSEAIQRRLFVVHEAAMVLGRQYPRPMYVNDCTSPTSIRAVCALNYASGSVIS